MKKFRFRYKYHEGDKASDWRNLDGGYDHIRRNASAMLHDSSPANVEQLISNLDKISIGQRHLSLLAPHSKMVDGFKEPHNDYVEYERTA